MQNLWIIGEKGQDKAAGKPEDKRQRKRDQGPVQHGFPVYLLTPLISARRIILRSESHGCLGKGIDHVIAHGFKRTGRGCAGNSCTAEGIDGRLNHDIAQ